MADNTGSFTDGFKALEDFGYGAMRVAGNASGANEIAETVVAETQSAAVGTTIINVWMERVDKAAASFHRVESQYPGRLVLGVGIGHGGMSGGVHQKPLRTLTVDVDGMVELGIPADRVSLAELRLRTLRPTRSETTGALAYSTTVEYTQNARSTVGTDRILSVVQAVPTCAERAAIRSVARRDSKLDLGLQNCVNDLNTSGYPHLQVGDSPRRKPSRSARSAEWSPGRCRQGPRACRGRRGPRADRADTALGQRVTGLPTIAAGLQSRADS